MTQVKVYALRKTIEEKRVMLSDAIHDSLQSALGLPAEKRFQRFIPLDSANFIYPSDRSDNYTIIEISMFEGRSVEAKKTLIKTLFFQLQQQAAIEPQDIEITLSETPAANWGIRGKTGDELTLNYSVTV